VIDYTVLMTWLTALLLCVVSWAAIIAGIVWAVG
jgi:hypothetical protein